MTNELGTTLQDIEAKAERKREALVCIDLIEDEMGINSLTQYLQKYIEEN